MSPLALFSSSNNWHSVCFISAQMKKGLRLWLFFLFLLFTLPLFSYEVPKPKQNEIIVLAMNEDQLAALLTIENYGAKCSPDGVCFGIDRINYTLLTKVKFLSGEREPNSKIRKKLLTAYFQNKTQTIQGFDSIEEFIDTMEEEWHKKNNPLKKAIEKIQVSQPPFKLFEQKIEKRNHFFQKGPSLFEEEAKIFENFIVEGVPITLAIANVKFAHQLTLVGFKQNTQEEDQVNNFYVLDSNYPEELQILTLKQNGWYYKSWKLEIQKGHVELLWEFPSKEYIQLAQKTFTPYYLSDKNIVIY